MMHAERQIRALAPPSRSAADRSRSQSKATRPTGLSDHRGNTVSVTQLVVFASTPARFFRTGGVVQRLIGPGVAPGTKVIVKRTTSAELHGAAGTIEQKGGGANEYIVRVGNELIVASADQLALVGEKIKAPEIEARTDQIARLSSAQLLQAIRVAVATELKPKKPFIVGGSFSILLHAFSQGRGARTPRDIDIILDPTDYAILAKGSPKPVTPTPHKIWGIPIELHRSGHFVSIDQENQKTGVVGLDPLLSKSLVKLRDLNFIHLTPAIPPPDTKLDAAQILQALLKENDRLMSMPDSEISAGHKEIWMKTLRDIQTLVASGATSKAYAQESTDDDW